MTEIYNLPLYVGDDVFNTGSILDHSLVKRERRSLDNFI